MSARDWGYAPGDSGYEYPDEEPECEVYQPECEVCEDTGIIESYPPHGIAAYLPTGDPIIDYIPCPACRTAATPPANHAG